MTGNRKCVRKQTPMYLKIHDIDSGHFTGSLLDLTVEGMKIQTWRMVEKDETLQCELILPDEIYNKKTVLLSARSVWCNKKDRSDFDYYEIGFQFKDLSPENHDIIEEALEKFFIEPIEMEAMRL